MQPFCPAFVYVSMKNEFLLLKTMGKTFRHVSFEIKREFAEQGMDITREKGMILRWLLDHDGIIQNELAWITDRDKTTLARLLNKMETQGLISRKQDKVDRRAKRIYISDTGRSLAEKIEAVLTKVATRLLSNVSQEHKDKTMETMYLIQDKITEDCKSWDR